MSIIFQTITVQSTYSTGCVFDIDGIENKNSPIVVPNIILPIMMALMEFAFAIMNQLVMIGMYAT